MAALRTFFRRPLLSAEKSQALIAAVAAAVPGEGLITHIASEAVFYVEASAKLSDERECCAAGSLVACTFHSCSRPVILCRGGRAGMAAVRDV
jgi:hypothetical protein